MNCVNEVVDPNPTGAKVTAAGGLWLAGVFFFRGGYGYADDVISVGGVTNASVSRELYTNDVAALEGAGQKMPREGYTTEGVAKKLHSMRCALGVICKDATLPDLLEFIYLFNINRYDDKLGPTFESLRNKGIISKRILL